MLFRSQKLTGTLSQELPIPLENSNIETVKDSPWKSMLGFLGKNLPQIIIVILVLGLGVWVFYEMKTLGDNTSGLKQDLLEQRAAHVEEIRQMTESFQRQQEAQIAIDRKFEDRLQVLSEQYEEALRGIAQTRRTRQRQIEENPSSLPSVFETTFGIRPMGNEGVSQ